MKGQRKIIHELADKAIEIARSGQQRKKQIWEKKKKKNFSQGTSRTVRKDLTFVITEVLEREKKEETKDKQNKNRIKPKKSTPRHITLLKTFKHHTSEHL